MAKATPGLSPELKKLLQIPLQKEQFIIDF